MVLIPAVIRPLRMGVTPWRMASCLGLDRFFWGAAAGDAVAGEAVTGDTPVFLPSSLQSQPSTHSSSTAGGSGEGDGGVSEGLDGGED